MSKSTGWEERISNSIFFFLLSVSQPAVDGGKRYKYISTTKCDKEECRVLRWVVGKGLKEGIIM